MAELIKAMFEASDENNGEKLNAVVEKIIKELEKAK